MPKLFGRKALRVYKFCGEVQLQYEKMLPTNASIGNTPCDIKKSSKKEQDFTFYKILTL